jgi:imidazolonepropionase-like amidohydrolase
MILWHALLLASAAAARGDTTEYTVFLAGRVAGEHRIVRDRPGAWTVRYAYTDRGRGADLTERIRLDPGGLPTRVEISGNDYYKNPVDERFERARGAARWRGSAEHDSAAVSGAAFYLGLNGTPAELAFLARALLQAPGNTLALLPAGTARLESAGALALEAGRRRERPRLFLIHGLDFMPRAVWLDRSGSLFAQSSGWMVIVRKGWEGAVPSLRQFQDSVAAAGLRKLAGTLARRPAGGVLLTGARVFDPRSGELQPDQSILVRGRRIMAVGAFEQVGEVGPADVIDVGGRVVIPGMWDMHVHTGDEDGLLHLAAGVTTVRDMGGEAEEILVRRRRWDGDTLAGPRLVLAGFMDGPGPLAAPIKTLVSTEAEARAAVDHYADLGAAQIKLYSSIDPAIVAAIIDQAHRRGLRASGHIPAGMSAEQAVRLGLDEIQHLNFVVLNFWADSIKATNTPLRLTAPGVLAALLDLDGPRVRDFVALLRDRGVVVDPTIAIFEESYLGRKGSISPVFLSAADRMPATVRRGFLSAGLPVPPGMDQRHRDSFAAMMRLTRLLHDSGVRLVAGTDAMPGFAYHRELELYGEAGIPPAQVLRIATLGAAVIMGMQDSLGTIEPGKLADLVVLDGDPLARLSDVRRAMLVIKDGALYDPASIYQAIGVRPITQR